MKCGPTHHNACDCREAYFREVRDELSTLKIRFTKLMKELHSLREENEEANKLLKDYRFMLRSTTDYKGKEK